MSGLTGEEASTTLTVRDGTLAVDAILALREGPTDAVLAVAQLADAARDAPGRGQMKATGAITRHQGSDAESTGPGHGRD